MGRRLFPSFRLSVLLICTDLTFAPRARDAD